MSRYVLGMLYALFWLPLLAQGEDRSSLQKPISAHDLQSSVLGVPTDGIVVSFQVSDEGTVPNDLSGRVDIQNVSTNVSITVKSFNLKPIGRLSGIYSPQDAWTAELPTLRFEPKSRQGFTVTFRKAREPSLFEHMSFRTGPTEFVATLSYYVGDKPVTKMTEFVVSPVVTTDKKYVVVGGLFGALLLIGFLISSRVLELARAGQLIKVLPRFGELSIKWSLVAIAYMFNGLLVALLLVLLSAGLTTFEMPIAFKLQDFEGGLVTGLFSVTLGKFLAEKFGLSSH